MQTALARHSCGAFDSHIVAAAGAGAQRADQGHDKGHDKSRKRRIAACLDVASGRLYSWQRSRFAVEALLHYYPAAARIYEVQDNWPVHFLSQVLIALDPAPIRLDRLPTYAPRTNPVEQV
jgi:hypothetical protein